MTRNNSEFGLAVIELALVGVGGVFLAVNEVAALPLPVVYWGFLAASVCACVAVVVGCVLCWRGE